jgi:hypothetical protein
MSENTDPTTGGTFAADDLADQQTANMKLILVQAGAPTTAYDGQVWACTSSDPLLLQMRDDTNSRWVQLHQRQYETGALAYKTWGAPPTLSGALDLRYSSGGTTTSGMTYLYFKANGLWWGLQNS